MEQKKCGKKIQLQPATKAAIQAMTSEGRGEIHSDTLGSYTGTPEKDWIPEQDADDI